ncbi:GFA family protein [Amaricoccus sp.]|uniref:GFA family protein n=1 Tax=Amaricoccus sp. TaxID=1872485 RepID=UPI001B6759BF|nr:GFA family protein [Amaricoccus sp.]MBP7240682.1 GFA family protein [Amaricoccus sp.]
MRGSCVCGACRFEADLAPGTEFHACHCETCRRWTGSVNFSVEVAPDAIRFDEPPAIAALRTSDWAERTWCARCGSNLFYRLTVGPKAGWMYLSLGLLDDPGAIPFGGEIYIDRKPETYALAGDHSRLTKAETEARFASQD